ncbi:hypothetical protein [Rhodococcus sp. KRD162]|uniref:hypothetical protein n=1 Tax=Rhodococcus sp. KRD162 TaxID=2729725 RepID=UPI0019CF6FA4|nr:hypothetical protein [Rhodococcus sp. KRD162]
MDQPTEQQIPKPRPPYPTTSHFLVTQLASDLDGLAFGAADWHFNFRTDPNYYPALAQAVLNAQAGWFLDMRTREWVLREQLSDEQKAMT